MNWISVPWHGQDGTIAEVHINDNKTQTKIIKIAVVD